MAPGQTSKSVFVILYHGTIDELLLPYRIDISILQEPNHENLRQHIERVGRVFYQRGAPA